MQASGRINNMHKEENFASSDARVVKLCSTDGKDNGEHNSVGFADII